MLGHTYAWLLMVSMTDEVVGAAQRRAAWNRCVYLCLLISQHL